MVDFYQSNDDFESTELDDCGEFTRDEKIEYEPTLADMITYEAIHEARARKNRNKR